MHNDYSILTKNNFNKNCFSTKDINEQTVTLNIKK